MTVGELIERLQRLPGDPDLRTVVVRMTLRRPYAGDVTVEGVVRDLSLGSVELNLDCFGYVE